MMLAREFFQLLLAGPSGDRAELLAIAKRRVMAQDSYSHPYYWAPFVLTGMRGLEEG
jgi:CHAT domain-containing protein